MAILDALLFMSDAQAGTASVASTYTIDTLAKGDEYVGDWLTVRVDTTYTKAGGTPTNTFQLQTSASSTFADGATTLAQSAALQAATLVAGYEWKIRIPKGVLRYLRVYKSTSQSGSDLFTAGKFDAFISKDTDMQQVLA